MEPKFVLRSHAPKVPKWLEHIYRPIREQVTQVRAEGVGEIHTTRK